MNDSTKSQALEQILNIARDNNLTLDDIGAVLTKSNADVKNGNMLTRILGYIGALFIFGGLCLFIGMQWDTFGSAARVIITYGTGLAAFVMGVLVIKDVKFTGASTPLFLASAALMPTGMFVFLDEYFDGDDTQLAAMVVFGILAFQFLVTFSVVRRTSLLFFGSFFYVSFLAILMDRCEVPPEILGAGLSLSILMVTHKIQLSAHRAIAPFWYIIGGVGLLLSAYDIFEETSFDIMLLGVSVAMIFVSVRVQSRTFLLVSAAGLLCFLGYYTNEYFKDIVGWPIALMVMGVMLVAISLWVVKLSQKMKV